ncbi:MAG: hypothetical protein VB112_07305 [Oscillospiraceae bacterium]|nr:hypothetical protein [Oscillospiraceae bacterium]
MKHIKNNPKFIICFFFGILFELAALCLRGTGNGQLVVTAMITGFLLFIVSYHMYKDPDRYKDDDDDDESDFL